MLTKPWNIHAEQLLPLGYGHALWYCQPDLNTRREVLVGDIGVFCEFGFDPLFNTMMAAEDPLNQGNVPEGFRQLADVNVGQTNLLTQPIVVSPSIILEGEPNTPLDAAARWRFRSQADTGALVVYDPPGIADDIDVRAKPAIINYMRENLDSWREHAASQKMALADKDLVFVSGTIKTTRWGTAAFRGCHSRGKGGYVSGELRRLGSGTFRFSGVPVGHTATGPMSADVAGAGANQCLFMHYYKMKRAASGDTTLGDDSFRYPEIKSSLPQEVQYDPVNCLLDYILKHSGASIAFASDMDVTNLFSGRTFPEWDRLPKAIKRASPPIEIDEHNVGTISVTRASVH